MLEDARRVLLAERVSRDHPITDDKVSGEGVGRRKPPSCDLRFRSAHPPPLAFQVITAWNGMMISAFCRAAQVLGRDDFAAAARSALDFVWASLGAYE